MDPISIIFAAYIDTVVNNLDTQMTERLGTEVTAEVIRYQGTTIQFQHQIWKIRDRSVCAPLQSDMRKYSECTLKAKSLFSDLCTEFGKSSSRHWRVSKTKNMYCNAAISFNPTVANISDAQESDGLENARRDCNLAIAAAMGKTEHTLINARDDACVKYRSIK